VVRVSVGNAFMGLQNRRTHAEAQDPTLRRSTLEERMWKFAIVGFSIAAPVLLKSVQPSNCASPDRRATAIRYARAINTAEASTFRATGRYTPLTQLTIGEVSGDYEVHLATDGIDYLFSIKDKTDACHAAVFSDQGGVIYTGVPLQ